MDGERVAPGTLSTPPVADPIAQLSVDEREALLGALEALRSGSGPQRPRLLVYGLGSFGDALQLTPLLHCLRRRFAQAEVILVHPHSLVRCLFAGHEDIDRLIVLPSPAHATMRSLVRAEALADLLVECRYVIQYSLVSGSAGLTPEEREFVESAQAGMPKDTRAYDFHVVKLNDDSAVVAYNLIVPGEHPRYRHMADTWAKIDGQWKLKFRQITPNLWSANDLD